MNTDAIPGATGRRARPAWLAVPLVMIAGCTGGLEVPEGAKLECASNDDCPEGFECVGVLKKCVAVKNKDTESPALDGQAIISPLVAAAGIQVSIQFTVTKPLAIDPVLALNASGAGAFALVRKEGGEYQYTYTVTGAEPQQSVTVVARLVGENGQLAEDLNIGQIRFDFTPPGFTGGSTLEPNVLRAGAEATLTVTATEDLKAPPKITRGDETLELLAEDAKNRTYQYKVRAQGTEPEGPFAMSAEIVDLAGNTLIQPGVASGEFDFTPPTVEGAAAIRQKLLRPGESAAIDVTFSERLGAAPEIVLRNTAGTELAMQRAEPAGNSYQFLRAMKRGEDGEYTPTLLPFTDIAGNEGSAATLDTIVVDGTPPGFVLPPEFRSGQSIRAGGKLEVAFLPDELDVDVLAYIDFGETTVPLEVKQGETEFTASYEVKGDGSEPEAAGIVAIILLDRAGNPSDPASPPGAVDFDFTPPTGEATITPPVSKPGDTVTVKLTASEPLAGGSELSATPAALVFKAGKPLGNELTWTYTVKAADFPAATGTQKAFLTAQLTDRAGNPAPPLALGELAVDFEPFELDGAKTTPEFAGAGREIRVELTFNKPVAQLDVLLGINPMDCEVTEASAVCSLLVAGDEKNGTYVPQVIARDAAGYEIKQPAPSVVIDTQGPELASTTRSSPIFKEGDLVFYTAEFNEPLAAAPQIFVTRNGVEVKDFFEPPAAGAGARTFVFLGTHPMQKNDDGLYEILLTGTDLAGNPGSDQAGLGFQVDATAPEAVAATAVGLSPANGRVKSGVALRVSFNYEDPATPSFTVTIDGRPMNFEFDTEPGFGWTFSYTPQSPADGGSDSEGPKTVTIIARDAAGNSAISTIPAEFDFTAPALAKSGPAAALTRLNEKVVYAAEFTEPVQGTPAVTVRRNFQPVNGFFSPPVIAPSGRAVTLTSNAATAPGDTGDYAVEVVATDTAGNTSKTLAGIGFKVDAAVPVVTGLTVAPALISRAQGNDQTRIEFKVSEDVGETAPGLVVKVGDNATTACSRLGSGPFNYSCLYTAQTSDTEGPKIVAIAVQDGAGNQGYAAAGVEFDFTPPTLTQATPNLTTYRIGDEVIYTADFSEAIASAPQITVKRADAVLANFFDAPTISASKRTYTYKSKAKVISSADEGDYTVTFRAADLAGNNTVGDLPGTGFKIDATAPGVSPVQVTPSRVSKKSGFNTVTIKFDIDENVGKDANKLFVRIASTTLDNNNCNLSGSGPVSYTCTYTVQTTDTEGFKSVTVQAIDTAGNSGSNGGTVVFDFTPPGVITASTAHAVKKPPNSPVVTVTKLTFDSKSTLDITANEQLKQTPTLKAVSGNQTFNYSAIKTDAPAFTFEATIPSSGTFPQGPYTITADMTDVAGNDATVTLTPTPGFDVDTGVPGAPDTATQDRIIYRRTPWGSEATSGNAAFTVAGAAGATDGEGTIFVFPTNSTLGNNLGTTDVNTDGSFGPLTLTAIDDAEIYLLLADKAGNVSPLTRVRDIIWTATIGSNIPGGGFTDPPVMESRPWFDPAQIHPSPTTLTATSGINRTGGAKASTNGGVTWRLIADDPTTLRAAAYTFDRARGEVVVFGGQLSSNDVPNNNLVVHRGAGWKTVTYADFESDGNPGLRALAALDYEPTSGKIVLFGGTNGISNLQDVWTYENASWKNITPLDSSPGDNVDNPNSRAAHAFVYDAKRGKHITFGGCERFNSTTDFDCNDRIGADTWEFDGTSWTKICGMFHDIAGEAAPTTACGPSARGNLGYAFDSARDRLVIFGGKDVTTRFSDTWEYNGAASTWTQVVTPGPSARSLTRMAYDEDRAVIVLFGGWDGTNPLGDTWEYNGATWTQITPTDAEGDGNPAPRAGHMLVYDPVRKRTVLYGGDDYTNPFKDWWEWNGTRWLRLGPSDPEGDGSPTGTQFYGMFWDTLRKHAIMFGGYPGASPSDATYKWTGYSWATLSPAAKPPARGSHQIAFDEARNTGVLFGGCAADVDLVNFNCANKKADTWEWNGTTWAEITPQDTVTADGNPGKRWSHSVSYDGDLGKIVVFGGRNRADGSCDGFADETCRVTWTWDGLEWDNVDTSFGGETYGRQHVTLMYDPIRKRSVMYGGYTGHAPDNAPSKMLELFKNPTNPAWQLASSNSPPGSLVLYATTFDAQREKVLIHGGTADPNAVVLRDKLWSWNGTTFTEIAQADPEGDGIPTPRLGHRMVYDPLRNEAMSFGGYGGGTSAVAETWLLKTGRDMRPGHVMRVPFVQAGTNGTETTRTITVNWYTGGTGFPGGTTTDGAQLSVWRDGAWKALAGASNSVSDSAPAKLTYTTTDAAEIKSLYFGSKRNLVFAATPVAANGKGAAYGSIATDYAEVIVTYRLP